MGRTEQFTVQVKGTAYKFAPIPPDELSMVVFVMNMHAGGTKTLSALTKVLSRSAGEEQWDKITDRLIAGELKIEDITVKLLDAIVKRQAKDAAAPAVDAE